MSADTSQLPFPFAARPVQASLPLRTWGAWDQRVPARPVETLTLSCGHPVSAGTWDASGGRTCLHCQPGGSHAS